MDASDQLIVSVPSFLSEFVVRRVAAGGFTDVADYVTSLVEADCRQTTLAEIEKLVVEGLQSGPPIPVDDAFWQNVRERLGRRSAATTP